MANNQDQDVKSLSIEKDKPKSDVLGPVYGEGKLSIKLRIPKEGGEKEEEGIDIEDQKIGFKHMDQMNKYRNDMKRVCHICSKAFSSGKALGGHMRIHVQQANKRDLIFKKNLKVRQTNKFKKQNPREEAEEKAVHFVKKNNKTRTTDNSYGVLDDMIGKPTCAVCGKDFRSMKSLYGHMRCHPDRNWKGIYPPSSTNSSSSSSLSDVEPQKIDDEMALLASGEKNRAVDLTASLRGWPVTARRGRRAVAAASSSEVSSLEDDQLRDAVNYLMMLARGGSFESGVTQRQEFGESEAANSFCKARILEVNQVSKSKKRMIGQSSVGIRSNSPLELLGNEKRGSNEVEKAFVAGSGVIDGGSVKKLEGQEWLEEQENNYFSDHDHLDNSMGQLNDKDSESSNFRVLLIKNKKKRKKVKLCDLELAKHASPVTPMHQKVVEVTSLTLQPDKYRCNICEKAFSSHQALGGHRSSHNKFKIIIHNSMDQNENLCNPTAQVEGTEAHNKRGYMICNKNPPTAQALGGHKRCHGSGPVQVSSSSEASHMCHRVQDFDLNEVPPSEDEAGFDSTCTW